MLGLGLAVALEDEAPGQRRHVTVNLGIEKIAKTYETSGESHGDTEVIHYPQVVETLLVAVPAGEPDHGKDKRYGAAMAGEPALPRLEDLPEAFPAAEIIIRLVKQAVPEARAHYRGYKERVKERVEKFLGHAFTLEEPFEYVPAEYESGDEQEGIPPDPETAYVEYDRVDVPVNCKKFKHKCKYKH